ncbi:hypothetical protein GCM10010413_33340 [Promicromonospora sukumoe]|uniref:Uncharacterized protein n=1 Tax=Promicromonospora sukumoe TaxID=88382 RepID=A0A7W3J889_9MICO|nr:hypothetical protein [Promicromonospora sukumoe]MBA8808088.1 hypothetical protein [Promicromonospora sukumoe]
MNLPRVPAWARSWLRLPDDPTTRPLPAVTVGTGLTVPGWALNAALLVLVPALLVTAAGRAPGLLPTTVAIAVIVCTALLVLRPTPTAAGVTVVVAGVLLLTLGEPGPLGLAVALLAYLVARCTWWAAHVPPRGRVETAALLTGRRRDVVVLGATGLLGALALLASGTTLPGVVLLAALAVAGTAFAALATRR